MIKRLFRSLAEKEETGFWLLDQNKLSQIFFYLLLIFLPTQLGKHFFPNFSFVYGLFVDYLSPTFYFTDLLIILIAIFSIKKVLKKALSYQKPLLIFFIFLLSLIVGIVSSKNPQAGVWGLLKLIEFTYLGTYAFLNFKNLNKKIMALCLSTGIIFETTLALLQYINLGSLQGIFYYLGERNFNGQTPGVANASINGALILRPYGTFSHPNVLGGFLVVATTWFLSFKNLLNKYFVGGVFAIATIGIIISFSRTAMVSWLIFFLLFFGASLVEKYQKVKVNSRVISYKNIFKIIFIFALFAVFVDSIFAQRITSLNLFDESILQREKLITESIRLILQNPVFGVGINNFINNLNPSFNSPLLLQPVHNIFLLVFSQTGIIGIVAFLLILTKSILISFSGKINIYKAGIILSVIFIGMLDHYFLTLQQGQILLVLVLAYALSKRD